MVKKNVVIRGCAVPLALLLMLTGSAVAGTPWYTSLSVPLYSQQTNQWCWAASGQMVMKYFGKSVSQCSQANHYVSRTDCCNYSLCPNPDNSSPCVVPGRAEYSYWGFNSTMTYGALSWTNLVYQIRTLRKPVDYQWYWTGGGAHIMVARGVQYDGYYNYVQINDPLNPCQGFTSWYNYTYWVSGGDHTHGWDIYNITKK